MGQNFQKFQDPEKHIWLRLCFAFSRVFFSAFILSAYQILTHTHTGWAPPSYKLVYKP